MFLGGDPSYEQKDTQLIQALGLNLKHVTVGAETAEVARYSQLIAQKKPVIFYWWTPEYRNAELNLVEVKLPARMKTCQDDGTTNAPIAKYRCAYSSLPAGEGVQHEVREERLPRRRRPEALGVAVERRPEPGLELDRGPAHGPAEGGREVREVAHGRSQQVAR